MVNQDAFVSGGPAPPPWNNVWSILMEGVRLNAHGLAIACMHQHSSQLSHLLTPRSISSSPLLPAPEDCLQWTYSDLFTTSLKLAGALHARGIQPTQTMMVFMESSVEWAVVRWAAARLGVTFVPCDVGILEREGELREVVRRVGPGVVVLGRGLGVDVAGLEGMFEGCVRVVCGGDRNGWDGMEEMILACDTSLSETADHDMSMSDQPATILFTSGTTSKSKGCPRKVAAISTSVHALTNRAIDKSSRYLIHSPNFRTICDQMSTACWRLGAAIILPSERFNTDATLKALTLFRCTHVSMVPAQLYALQRSPLMSQIVPRQLQRVFLSGDIITRHMLEMAQESLQPIWTVPQFGMTEGGTSGSALALRWGDEIVFTEGGIACVGFALPGTSMRVCAVGTTDVMKRGEKGELHFSCTPTSVRDFKPSCPPIIGSYLDDRYAESFFEDEKGRWFKSGDLAMIDESGLVFILGRTKDIVKYKGINLSPAVFEDCLNPLTGGESQVVDVSHQEFGQVAVAIIKCDEALDAKSREKLKASVTRELGMDYMLAEVYELHELGLKEWPTNASGKVVKVELRKVLEWRRMGECGHVQVANSLQGF